MGRGRVRGRAAAVRRSNVVHLALEAGVPAVDASIVVVGGGVVEAPNLVVRSSSVRHWEAALENKRTEERSVWLQRDLNVGKTDHGFYEIGI